MVGCGLLQAGEPLRDSEVVSRDVNSPKKNYVENLNKIIISRHQTNLSSLYIKVGQIFWGAFLKWIVVYYPLLF